MLPRVTSLFTVPAVSESSETFATLIDTQGLRLEHIVSHGQPSPPGHWYDQPDPEWVLLVRGRATLEFVPGGRLELAAGDHLLIPARIRHRVAACSPDAVWVALHYREAPAP